MSYVKTCISMPKEQARFLKECGYSASRLFQNQVSKLMKESEGHLCENKPTEESGEDSNNG